MVFRDSEYKDLINRFHFNETGLIEKKSKKTTFLTFYFKIHLLFNIALDVTSK